MLLTEVCEQLIDQRDVKHATAIQYRKSATAFGEFLGRPAKIEDLSETVVNRWLREVAESGASPFTVHGRKRGLTAIWNFAAVHHGAKRYDPQLLRRVRLVYPPVVPWTLDQMPILMAAAGRVPGRIMGIPAADYLSAFVRLHYETGLRPSDMRLLCWWQIDVGECRVSVVQHKTSKPHTARITQASADLLRAMMPADFDPKGKVFPCSKSGMRRWERKLFAEAVAAGFKRRKGQSLGFLRKTHGTEVARVHGLEVAARSLGHASGTIVARQSYVAADAIAPPPLAPGFDNAQEASRRTRGRDKGRPAA